MLEVYGCISPNVLKVLVGVEEVGTPYHYNYVSVLMGENQAAEFAALNPNRKVPIIVDPDGPDGKSLVVWESGAILIYLAEKAGVLIPNDAGSRYAALQWLMFQMSGIGPMFGQYVHFSRYAQSQTYSRDRYYTEVLRLYDVTEGRLQQSRFLAGNEYSIADISAWPWLYMLEIEGLDRSNYPNMNRWIAEIADRPAVERAMVVFSSMKFPDMVQFGEDHPDHLDRFFGRGRYSRARVGN